MAAMTAAQTSNRRGAARDPVGAESTLRTRAAGPADIVLHDLSPRGASIEIGDRLEPGSVVSIGLPGVGSVEAVVIWRTGDRHGCGFTMPLSDEALARAFATEVVVTGQFAGTVTLVENLRVPGRWPGRWNAVTKLLAIGIASATIWALILIVA